MINNPARDDVFFHLVSIDFIIHHQKKRYLYEETYKDS